MDESLVLEIASQAMTVTAKLAAPVLLTALFIGLFIGLIQSATQLNEPTLVFVPKFIGCGLVILVTGSWMMQEMITFTENLFETIPRMLSS